MDSFKVMLNCATKTAQDRNQPILFSQFPDGEWLYRLNYNKDDEENKENWRKRIAWGVVFPNGSWFRTEDPEEAMKLFEQYPNIDAHEFRREVYLEEELWWQKEAREKEEQLDRLVALKNELRGIIGL